MLIRGGEYRLSETKVFTRADNHYDACQIVYMAFADENPVYSSDVEITGWQLAKSVKNLPTVAKGKVYVSPMPKLPEGTARFYTMYENGRLLTRARSKGFEPTKIMTGGDGGGIAWKGMMKADRNSLWFPDKILNNQQLKDKRFDYTVMEH